MIVHKLKSEVGSIILENDTSIGRSDIAIFGGSGNFFAFWINGTQPTIVGQQGAGTPDTAFPFARLASVTLADESATFLYHQINGTTFAEEQWDASVNIWTTTDYITVSGS